jgi:hypothetical protein
MYRQIALARALVLTGVAVAYSPAASMAQEKFVLPQDRIGQSLGGLAVNSRTHQLSLGSTQFRNRFAGMAPSVVPAARSF